MALFGGFLNVENVRYAPTSLNPLKHNPLLLPGKLKLPIQFAETILSNVSGAGFQMLETFTLSHMSIDQLLQNISKSEYSRMPTHVKRVAGLLGQEYFKMWLGDEKLDTHGVAPNRSRVIDFSRVLADGVYYLEFAGNDTSLFFVWIVNGNTVTFVCTHPGSDEIIFRKHSRMTYFEKFKNAVMGDVAAYVDVFGGIQPPQSSLEFEYLKIRKSNRY